MGIFADLRFFQKPLVINRFRAIHWVFMPIFADLFADCVSSRNEGSADPIF
jgi:hypothetical protein